MTVGKPKASGSVEVGRLRPFLVHPTAVAWKILPVSLKKQVGSIERLELFKGMFGPRDPAETTEETTSEDHETTETTNHETTEVVSETTSETTDTTYEPSDANHPEVSWTEADEKLSENGFGSRPLLTEPRSFGKSRAAQRFMDEIAGTIERKPRDEQA